MFCMLINGFVSNTISSGYDLPFVALPSTRYLENNVSSIASDRLREDRDQRSALEGMHSNLKQLHFAK